MQGDQIGRIFANLGEFGDWANFRQNRAVVFLGSFLKTEGAQIFVLLSLQGENGILILAKLRVGSHFGRFFH
jgi:hypothetical protein